MKLQTDAIGLVTLILVSLAWLMFGAIFLFRPRTARAEEAKRARGASWGIALQSLSFASVWSLPRPRFWPATPSSGGEIALATVAVALVYASCWLCFRSVQGLGKQWTYAARVIKGHELITQGPYAVVRNPIYFGMFGLVIGTGLAFARWWTLLAAVVFFLAGNHLRIRAEENLLRETFGSRFEDYARRVPSFFPRLF
jgi:protein-S-isoprenylcysteine O-methyltransferase Ste14